MIPHTEYKINSISKTRINWNALKELGIVSSDFLIGLLVSLIVLTMARESLWLLVAGFVAVLPDSVNILHYILPKNIIRIINIGHILHTDNKKPPILLGVSTQLIIIIASIIFILA